MCIVRLRIWSRLYMVISHSNSPTPTSTTTSSYTSTTQSLTSNQNSSIFTKKRINMEYTSSFKTQSKLTCATRSSTSCHSSKERDHSMTSRKWSPTIWCKISIKSWSQMIIWRNWYLVVKTTFWTIKIILKQYTSTTKHLCSKVNRYLCT